MSQERAPEPGQPVNVPIQALLDQLHAKYGRVVQQLIQENAELQAGVEAQAAELAYLRSAVAAQQEATVLGALGGVGAPAATPGDVGQEGPQPASASPLG